MFKIRHNQVINEKRLTLTYYYCGDEDLKYFLSIVMPYLEQMIPSTAIFDVKLVNTCVVPLVPIPDTDDNTFISDPLTMCFDCVPDEPTFEEECVVQEVQITDECVPSVIEFEEECVPADVNFTVKKETND